MSTRHWEQLQQELRMMMAECRKSPRTQQRIEHHIAAVDQQLIGAAATTAAAAQRDGRMPQQQATNDVTNASFSNRRGASSAAPQPTTENLDHNIPTPTAASSATTMLQRQERLIHTLPALRASLSKNHPQLLAGGVVVTTTDAISGLDWVPWDEQTLCLDSIVSTHQSSATNHMQLSSSSTSGAPLFLASTMDGKVLLCRSVGLEGGGGSQASGVVAAFGHPLGGSVLGIHCKKDTPGVFLSCGGDGGIHLWRLPTKEDNIIGGGVLTAELLKENNAQQKGHQAATSAAAQPSRGHNTSYCVTPPRNLDEIGGGMGGVRYSTATPSERSRTAIAARGSGRRSSFVMESYGSGAYFGDAAATPASCRGGLASMILDQSGSSSRRSSLLGSDDLDEEEALLWMSSADDDDLDEAARSLEALPRVAGERFQGQHQQHSAHFDNVLAPMSPSSLEASMKTGESPPTDSLSAAPTTHHDASGANRANNLGLMHRRMVTKQPVVRVENDTTNCVSWLHGTASDYAICGSDNGRLLTLSPFREGGAVGEVRLQSSTAILCVATSSSTPSTSICTTANGQLHIVDHRMDTTAGTMDLHTSHAGSAAVNSKKKKTPSCTIFDVNGIPHVATGDECHKLRVFDLRKYHQAPTYLEFPTSIGKIACLDAGGDGGSGSGGAPVIVVPQHGDCVSLVDAVTMQVLAEARRLHRGKMVCCAEGAVRMSIPPSATGGRGSRGARIAQVLSGSVSTIVAETHFSLPW